MLLIIIAIEFFRHLVSLFFKNNFARMNYTNRLHSFNLSYLKTQLSTGLFILFNSHAIIADHKSPHTGRHI